MAPTSYPLALAALVPLPFDIIFCSLRFWIRWKRNAWGPDDWVMVVNVPFWVVSVVATCGLAWSGIGADESTLSTEQYSNSLMWFYIFQEPWCFTLITTKLSIGFALIRIANGKRWMEVIIYTLMTACFFIMGGTGMYLFFRCDPIQRNWDNTIPGKCQDRDIQTVLSYVVAALLITTDWTFAVLPIFFLWNVQLDWRVKLPVIGMLGLGVFASIAPIIRLKYLIGMSDNIRFFERLAPILCWASVEINIGMLVANLPACRPILERCIHHFTSWTNSGTRSGFGDAGSNQLSQNICMSRSVANRASEQYHELDERGRPGSRQLRDFLKNGSKAHSGFETKIYGDFERDSLSSVDRGDDGSMRNIVHVDGLAGDAFHVSVQRDFTMEVSTSARAAGKMKGDRMV